MLKYLPERIKISGTYATSISFQAANSSSEQTSIWLFAPHNQEEAYLACIAVKVDFGTDASRVQTSMQPQQVSFHLHEEV